MRKDIFGLAKQTAMGSPQTVMEYFPPVRTVSAEANRETLEEDETTGTRFPAGIEYGSEFHTVTAELAPRFASLPRLLSAFLGAPASSQPDPVGAPTAWDHVLDPVAADPALVPHSVFVVRSDPNPAIVDLYTDVLGNEFTLSVEGNSFLTLSAALIARLLDGTQLAPSVTLDTSKRVTFDQVLVHLDVDGAGEAPVKCRSFSVAYSNGIATDDIILGQRELDTLDEGNASAEITFMPSESLSDHYRRALQADPADVRLRAVATGALIGGAVIYKVEVVCESLEYLSAPAPVNAAERLRALEVTARAKYDVAAGAFVTVTVTNEVASY